MTPAEKYDAARAALEQHEREHYPLKDRYDASLKRLEALTMEAANAWHEVSQATGKVAVLPVVRVERT